MIRPATTWLWILGTYFIFSAEAADGQGSEKTVGRDEYFLCSTPQETEVDKERLREAEEAAEAIRDQMCPPSPFGMQLPCGFVVPIIGVEDDTWKHANHELAAPGHSVTVNVAFLDGKPEQRAWVRTYAAEWIHETGVAMVLNFNDAQRNQIRVSFARSDNRSEIGNQALEVKSPGQPTMYLGDVQSWKTPERVRQIILHEFGHAFGLRHEHQHPQSGIVWDEAAIHEDFPQLSIDTIRADITGMYTRDYLCIGAEKFDSSSIMMYPIPMRWTKNEKSFMPALKLSELDKTCLLSLYGQLDH